MKPTTEEDIRQALRDEGLDVAAGGEVTLAREGVNRSCQVCGVILPRSLRVNSPGSDRGITLCPDRIQCRERAASEVTPEEKTRAETLEELLDAVNIPESGKPPRAKLVRGKLGGCMPPLLSSDLEQIVVERALADSLRIRSLRGALARLLADGHTTAWDVDGINAAQENARNALEETEATT